MFHAIVDRALPLTLVKSDRLKGFVDNRWYTPELRELKHKCIFYYDMYKQNGLMSFKTKYMAYKNMYKSKIKSAKEKYFSSIFFNTRNKSKFTWSVVSDLINTSTKQHSSSDLNADDFNKAFLNSVEEIITSIPNNSNYNNFLSKLSKLTSNFVFKHVSLEIMYKKILN